MKEITPQDCVLGKRLLHELDNGKKPISECGNKLLFGKNAAISSFDEFAL